MSSSCGEMPPGSGTDKANAALKTLARDYGKYVNSVYNTESDLFAAYPLWIDTQSVTSELASSKPRAASTSVQPRAAWHPSLRGSLRMFPRRPRHCPYPKTTSGTELVQSNAQNTQVSRYTEALSSAASMGTFKTPSSSRRLFPSTQ